MALIHATATGLISTGWRDVTALVGAGDGSSRIIRTGDYVTLALHEVTLTKGQSFIVLPPGFRYGHDNPTTGLIQATGDYQTPAGVYVINNNLWSRYSGKVRGSIKWHCTEAFPASSVYEGWTLLT